MSKKKHAAREGSEEEQPEEETEGEETPEGQEQKKAVASQITAKTAALAIAGLIVGIVIGQVALPGLGIGLIGLPAEGSDTAVDMAELQTKVQNYLYENFMEPQGVEGEIISIESFSDSLYIVKFEISMDGQPQGGSELFLTKDGLILIAGPAFMLDEPVGQLEPQQPQQPQPSGPPVVGELMTFNDSGYDIELQDGKPVIRLFSTTWCPHCVWVKETFDKVAKEYVDAGKIVAHHWEVDTQDDTLTEEVETEVPASEMAVYREFNPGGSIPTFIFGGRYHRVGNGYENEDDLAAEEAEFRAVIEILLEEANQ